MPVTLPVKPHRPKPPKPTKPKRPRLSIVIPTPGQGRPLERTLRSINHQRSGQDEVIVCHDTVDGIDPEVRSLCAAYGCRYLAVDPGFHSWGHQELNAGFAAATGDYIIGQDDDDIFMPDALDSIRAQIEQLAEPRVLLFKFVTPWRQVLWQDRLIAEGQIGGHCIVTPNVPGKIGTWTSRYCGDFDYIVETVGLWGNDPVWCEEIIAWTRPTDEETARLIPTWMKVPA